MISDFVYSLQKSACNCNDCFYLSRELHRQPKDVSHSSTKCGYCKTFNKVVLFNPNTHQYDTQDCFIHKDDVIAHITTDK